MQLGQDPRLATLPLEQQRPWSPADSAQSALLGWSITPDSLSRFSLQHRATCIGQNDNHVLCLPYRSMAVLDTSTPSYPQQYGRHECLAVMLP